MRYRWELKIMGKSDFMRFKLASILTKAMWEKKKCLIYEMPLIKKDKRLTLNPQTDSLPPKRFT